MTFEEAHAILADYTLYRDLVPTPNYNHWQYKNIPQSFLDKDFQAVLLENFFDFIVTLAKRRPWKIFITQPNGTKCFPAKSAEQYQYFIETVKICANATHTSNNPLRNLDMLRAISFEVNADASETVKSLLELWIIALHKSIHEKFTIPVENFIKYISATIISMDNDMLYKEYTTNAFPRLLAMCSSEAVKKSDELLAADTALVERARALSKKAWMQKMDEEMQKRSKVIEEPKPTGLHSQQDFMKFLENTNACICTGMNWNTIARLTREEANIIEKFFADSKIRYNELGKSEGLIRLTIYSAITAYRPCKKKTPEESKRDSGKLAFGCLDFETMGVKECAHFKKQLMSPENSTGLGKEYQEQILQKLQEVKPRKDVECWTIEYHSGTYNNCMSSESTSLFESKAETQDAHTAAAKIHPIDYTLVDKCFKLLALNRDAIGLYDYYAIDLRAILTDLNNATTKAELDNIRKQLYSAVYSIVSIKRNRESNVHCRDLVTLCRHAATEHVVIPDWIIENAVFLDKGMNSEFYPEIYRKLKNILENSIEFLYEMLTEKLAATSNSAE